MRYMDVKTAAAKWELKERRITALCRADRIDGAVKDSGTWLIPYNAEKPVDRRSQRYPRKLYPERTLPVPIGVSAYKEMAGQYYYVDKTNLIKDFLDTRPKVSLFTRPRRFGKTLNMDMLRVFFEKTDEDTSVYFRDKNIWKHGEAYTCHQGKYPVIFLSFKDVKCSTWEDTLYKFKFLISSEFHRHPELKNSTALNEDEKAQFQMFTSGKGQDADYESCLRILAGLLHKHYGEPAIIIIDEYDTPIQMGHVCSFYENVVRFMRNFFSEGLKDNPHLAYGFLTGILRVAKESIFSGLNNLTVHSVLDERYDEYFGFTAEEVREMARYYGAEEKFETLCDWYDGYRFGNAEIFNPWSILNFFYYDQSPRPYWQSTGDNSIIRQIVAEADEDTADNLRKLLQGHVVSSYVDTSVIYPEIKGNPTTIYSFLLSAGYLTAEKRMDLYDGNFICDISIPNKELRSAYGREVLTALTAMIPQSASIAIQQAIVLQDVPGLEKALQKLLLHSISSFDCGQETFYHGLLLGICAIMNNMYLVESNRESGYGRFDIQLQPLNKKLPGVIIELKVLKEAPADDRLEAELEKAAQAALDQIDQKQYITAMKQEGISSFFKIGVAFHKKHVKLLSKSE